MTTTALHVRVKDGNRWKDEFWRLDPNPAGGGFLINVTTTGNGLRFPIINPPIGTVHDPTGGFPTIEYMDLNGDISTVTRPYARGRRRPGGRSRRTRPSGP